MVIVRHLEWALWAADDSGVPPLGPEVPSLPLPFSPQEPRAPPSWPPAPGGTGAVPPALVCRAAWHQCQPVSPCRRQATQPQPAWARAKCREMQERPWEGRGGVCVWMGAYQAVCGGTTSPSRRYPLPMLRVEITTLAQESLVTKETGQINYQINFVSFYLQLEV